jgi:hypothetical protein
MTAPRDLAAWTRTCGLPRLDAQALIEAVLGWSRAQQAAHPERCLTRPNWPGCTRWRRVCSTASPWPMCWESASFSA